MNQLEILTIHVKCFVEILTLAQFSGRQKGLFDTQQSRTLPHSSMIVSKKYTTPLIRCHKTCEYHRCYYYINVTRWCGHRSLS
jgi:hypothetical protein